MLWVEKKSNLWPTLGTPYLSWFPLMSINLFFSIPVSLIITSIIWLYWIHSASSCLELVLLLSLASEISNTLNSKFTKRHSSNNFFQNRDFSTSRTTVPKLTSMKTVSTKKNQINEEPSKHRKQRNYQWYPQWWRQEMDGWYATPMRACP